MASCILLTVSWRRRLRNSDQPEFEGEYRQNGYGNRFCHLSTLTALILVQ